MVDQQLIPAHKRLHLHDLVWLVYGVFFLIEPMERRSAAYWAESLGALAFFVLLYVAFLCYANCQLRLSLLFAMFLLGAVLFPWNGGAPAFMIYAAAFLPLTISSLPWVVALLCLDAGTVTAIGQHLHLSPYSWMIDALMIFVAGLINITAAQKLRADCKLRMKQEEIEALAAVAERERIARDLHDILGHTLSVIVLKSELAHRLLDRELHMLLPLAATKEGLSSHSGAEPFAADEEPAAQELSSRSAAEGSAPEELSSRSAAERSAAEELSSRSAAEGSAVALLHANTQLNTEILQRACAEIADVERTARTALAEVREAIGGYRARGLGAEIDAARQTLATAGVELTTEGDLQPATLTAAEETVLSLALREAVTNIVRHARATHCRLHLVLEHGHHRLSVEDNGEHAATREGNGLRGMRERVESLGGHLSLSRQGGTQLVIDLPQRA